MLRVIAIVALIGLPVSLASAQTTSSRLDDVVKSGKLRVCTPGDYKPFSLQRPDGGYEGLDIDLVQASAKSLGVEVEMVKTAWPALMKKPQLASTSALVSGSLGRPRASELMRSPRGCCVRSSRSWQKLSHLTCL